MDGTYADFWGLNPRRLEIVIRGYEKRQKLHLDRIYLSAEYGFLAHSAALANLFRGKGQKPVTFREFIEPPKENKPLTPEEIKKKRELFYMQFMVKKDNFELAQKEKGG